MNFFAIFRLFSARERRSLFILALLQFLHVVDFMIIMPLGPTLMTTLNLSAQDFSILISSYTFSATVSSLLFSFISDRTDRKKALLIFFAGFALGTLGCGLVSNFWSLLLMRVLAGFFGGVISSIVLAILGDLFEEGRRATAMGIVMTAFSLSAIVGVPLGLILSETFNWEAPFIALGILSISLFPLARALVPSMIGHMEKKPVAGQTSRFYWGLPFPLTLMGLLVFGQFMIIPFISPSLVFNAGLPNHQLSLIYITGGLLTVVSSPLIGRLADMFGSAKIFLVAVLLSCLPIFFITHLGTSGVHRLDSGVNPLGWILLISGSFFVATSARMVPAMAIIQTSLDPAFRGRLMSYVNATQQLASSLAAFTAGSIVLKDEGGRLIHYTFVGWLSIAMALLAFVLVAFVAHRQR